MMKYKKYKASDIDWLGDIPEHWEVHRIKNICDYINRGTTPFYVERSNFKVINQATFSKGYINEENIKFTDKKDTSRGILKFGDILIASTGGGILGKTILFNKNENNYIADSHVTILRDSKKRFIPSFLHYYLSINFHLINELLALGSTNQTELQKKELLAFQFVFPPLSEQNAIAQYLDTKSQAIDAKINLLTQKATYYKQLRKSIINNAVCKGLDKNVKLKESGIEWIGKIPEHWEIKRLKAVAKTIKGKNLDFFDEPFENSLPNLSLDYLRNDSVTFSNFCYSSDKTLLASDSDCIIIWDGAGVGEILKGKKGFISSTTAKFVFDKKFSSKYFWHLRDNIEYTLKQIPTGMGIPHLNPHVLNNYPCPNPPLKEQIQIAEYLDEKTQKIDSVIDNITTQISTLKELRKTLINDVVTGKIKVINN